MRGKRLSFSTETIEKFVNDNNAKEKQARDELSAQQAVNDTSFNEASIHVEATNTDAADADVCSA